MRVIKSLSRLSLSYPCLLRRSKHSFQSASRKGSYNCDHFALKITRRPPPSHPYCEGQLLLRAALHS